MIIIIIFIGIKVGKKSKGTEQYKKYGKHSAMQLVLWQAAFNSKFWFLKINKHFKVS